MVINTSQQIFDGVVSTVITGTGTIADGVFAVAGTNAAITEYDNSAAADRWPMARLTLAMPDTFDVAPTIGSTIDVYRFITSPIVEVPPTTALQKGAVYVGAFRLFAADLDQPKQIEISMLGVSKCKFSIQNKSDVVMSFSAGFTLKIEGFGFFPSAA